jgi:phosphoribosyl 1,2-cyclic phosphodiesterase
MEGPEFGPARRCRSLATHSHADHIAPVAHLFIAQAVDGFVFPQGGGGRAAGGDGDVDDGFPGGRVDDLAGRLRLNEEAGD